MDTYLKEIKMLDYSNAQIQKLIRDRGWLALPEFERTKAIYNYVRDEILFGYNRDDSILASDVLRIRRCGKGFPAAGYRF